MLVLGQHVVEWVGKRLKADFTGGQGIGWTRDDVLVAGAVFEKHNEANIYLHFVIDDKRMPPTFLAAIMDYPFNQLKVRRLTGVIADSNEPSKELARRLGGRLEGVMLEALPDGGNLCIYGLLRRDACRWLSEPLQRRLERYRGKHCRGRIRKTVAAACA